MVIRIFLCIVLAVTAFSCERKNQKRPCTIVVFGATGDLTSRKLMPALSNLNHEKKLPEKFAIVGVGRRDYTNEDFRKLFPKSADLEKRLFYAKVDFEKKVGYDGLEKRLAEIDREFGAKSNRIYFLASAARHFFPIIEQLDSHGLIYDSVKDPQWSRIMIEKPFGRDLESAVQLQDNLAQTLAENQIYLIDHYLGKTGLQDLLLFRMKGEYENFWNNRHIDHVQITLSEEIGIGTRSRFWEETGLLRDVFQNHLLQILSFVAIDLPAKDLAAEKIKLLNSIRPISMKEIVRGQYGPGKNVPGYREEPDVPKSSYVETFAAAKLWIDNERWSGVPFYLRAGKRLPKQGVMIAIHFKNNLNPLIIRIQPNPGIFWNGKSLFVSQTGRLEAYETLFLDCIRGDRSHFVQSEEEIAAWRLLTPVLEEWAIYPPQETFPNYSAGTWGPDTADRLLQDDRKKWGDIY